MKQMSLIEMDGFLKGKCIPRDLKVNETNAEYLVRKFAEAEAKCAALAAENAAMHETIEAVRSVADNSSGIAGWHLNGDIATWEEILPEINDIETQVTDAFLAEIRAEARNEGINYTASRLAAAFNHGFINKSLREVFDVTRMILSAKEELANEAHPIDGLSGEYAEKSLEEWAEQLRKGGNQ
ncbi:hypothetical protein VVX58_01100 [Escherichia coli]|nr:hypothetical protein [Escherichia coli]MEC4956452.1 hypothetical protein [Escherichia coli]MEC5135175.1 hypothetical protein [Escherichia coli]